VDRAAKEDLVAELREAFEQSAILIVTQQTRMTVFESQELRKSMRDAGARFKVAKNRLVRLALEDTPFQGVSDQLTGPTGFIWSADPVGVSKAILKYAKKNDKLTILAAAFGTQILDKDGVEAVSKMPSLDELRGTLVGLLQAPAVKVVGILPAPAQQVVGVMNAGAAKLPRVLQAYAQKEAA